VSQLCGDAQLRCPTRKVSLIQCDLHAFDDTSRIDKILCSADLQLLKQQVFRGGKPEKPAIKSFLLPARECGMIVLIADKQEIDWCSICTKAFVERSNHRVVAIPVCVEQETLFFELLELRETLAFE
jgi:hypothetical protein